MCFCGGKGDVDVLQLKSLLLAFFSTGGLAECMFVPDHLRFVKRNLESERSATQKCLISHQVSHKVPRNGTMVLHIILELFTCVVK